VVVVLVLNLLQEVAEVADMITEILVENLLKLGHSLELDKVEQTVLSMVVKVDMVEVVVQEMLVMVDLDRR